MKYRMIKILGIIVLFIVALVAIYYLIEGKKEEPTDAQKFAQEYTEVGKDNIFVYKTANEIVNILESQTGIIYFGFPECPWCQRYVVMLNEVAKEKGIEQIYYYNIRDIRTNKTPAYQEIVTLLSVYLPLDDEGNKKVMVPDISFVVNGKIKWHDNETSTFSSGTPDEYWTEERTAVFKEKLGNAIDEIFYGQCTSCNE